MLCQFLALFGRDCTLRFEIALISYENARDVVTCVFFDLRHPVLNSGEGLSISDIVGDNYAVRSLVVAGSNSLEAFLTSCIPNLEFDCLLINIDGSDFEVDTDCGHEVV